MEEGTQSTGFNMTIVVGAIQIEVKGISVCKFMCASVSICRIYGRNITFLSHNCRGTLSFMLVARRLAKFYVARVCLNETGTKTCPNR